MYIINLCQKIELNTDMTKIRRALPPKNITPATVGANRAIITWRMRNFASVSDLICGGADTYSF
jgi:hypothetical protein